MNTLSKAGVNKGIVKHNIKILDINTGIHGSQLLSRDKTP